MDQHSAPHVWPSLRQHLATHTERSLQTIATTTRTFSFQGRMTTLAATWRLCWQKMSCLGQSLGVKALSSTCEDLQLAGIDFVETLILLYTERATLSAAGRPLVRSTKRLNCDLLIGSGCGAPTADMLLFNCRYLIDQLTEQLATEGPSGKGPLSLVRSLARIVSRREKYFDSLVPHLLKHTSSGKYRLGRGIPTASSSELSFEMQLATALKQALLSLMQCNISNRQKSMLLLGLSQLGSTEDTIGLHRNLTSESLSFNASWYTAAMFATCCLQSNGCHVRNYRSDGPAETPQAKRVRFDPGSSPELDEPSEPSTNKDFAKILIDQAKSLFLGKLSVEELEIVLAILHRNGHGDCIKLITEQLDPALVMDIVIRGFTHSTVLT